jgi:hypothetical protein
MLPLHTLYAVMTVNFLSSWPRKDRVLQRPRPEVSLWSSPVAIGTIELVAIVRVPPDW